MIPNRYGPAVVKPGFGARLNRGHPWAYAGRMVYCCLFNEPTQNMMVANLARPDVRGTVTNAGHAAKSKFGVGVDFYQTSPAQHVDFGTIGEDVLGTTEVTFLIGYKKTDATNRNSGAFGVVSATTSQRCGPALPWSDGVIYWDYGGNSGGHRVSVAGLTFGDDIYAFTNGPRGHEVWQNGNLVGSNSTNSTRTASSNTFRLGYNAGFGNDVAIFSFFYAWTYQLPQSAIRALSAAPFAIIGPRVASSGLYLVGYSAPSPPIVIGPTPGSAIAAKADPTVGIFSGILFPDPATAVAAGLNTAAGEGPTVSITGTQTVVPAAGSVVAVAVDPAAVVSGSGTFEPAAAAAVAVSIAPTLIIVPPVLANLRLRITEMNYGNPGILEIKAVDDDLSIYTSTVPGGTPPAVESTRAQLPGSTTAVLLDSVLLRDADNGSGFYLATSGVGSAWRGASISKSADDGATYDGVTNVLRSAVIGIAETALATTARPEDWDMINTVDIRLIRPNRDTLSGASELAVLNGANAAALQTRAGLVEIFQFQTATALGGGLYRLGGLLRARRGSDFAMGTHAAGDMFVLLATDTISRVPTDSGEIGAERIYRATSFGTFSDASRRHAFTDSGASLKPLSAVHVKGARDGSSNLTITWIRRTRIGQRWIDFSDVPLGEDSEAYEVDIYNAGWTAVLRTIAVTAQTASYTAAQQTTDFGAPQAAINIKVYQISAAVGRGFAATATV